VAPSTDDTVKYVARSRRPVDSRILAGSFGGDPLPTRNSPFFRCRRSCSWVTLPGIPGSGLRIAHASL
jgi:hypothetical protein